MCGWLFTYELQNLHMSCDAYVNIEILSNLHVGDAVVSGVTRGLRYAAFKAIDVGGSDLSEQK